MKNTSEHTMEISSILEEIEDVKKMIELNNKNTAPDREFMVEQYMYKLHQLYNELLSELTVINPDSFNRLLNIFKLLGEIYIYEGGGKSHEDVDKKLIELEKILA